MNIEMKSVKIVGCIDNLQKIEKHLTAAAKSFEYVIAVTRDVNELQIVSNMPLNYISEVVDLFECYIKENSIDVKSELEKLIFEMEEVLANETVLPNPANNMAHLYLGREEGMKKIASFVLQRLRPLITKTK
jgi:hypothetical protein